MVEQMEQKSYQVELSTTIISSHIMYKSQNHKLLTEQPAGWSASVVESNM